LEKAIRDNIKSIAIMVDMDALEVMLDHVKLGYDPCLGTLFNFKMKTRIKRLSIMSKIEMWLLLAEVAKGMTNGQ